MRNFELEIIIAALRGVLTCNDYHSLNAIAKDSIISLNTEQIGSDAWS